MIGFLLAVVAPHWVVSGPSKVDVDVEFDLMLEHWSVVEVERLSVGLRCCRGSGLALGGVPQRRVKGSR